MPLINWKAHKDILFYNPIGDLPTEDELVLKPEEEGKTYIRVGFNRIRLREKAKSLQKRLKQLKSQLTTQSEDLDKLGLELERMVNLSSIKREKREMSKQQDATYSKYVNHNGEPLVMFDETMNNREQLDKEYDITIDTKTGQVWIANNNGNSEVILQGSISGYAKKGQSLPGAYFNYEDAPGKNKAQQKDLPYTPALFSGSIYFEDLPVDVFESFKDLDDPKPLPALQEEITNQHKGPVNEHNTQDDITVPSREELEGIPAGKLRAPRKFSRREKARWRKKLRDLYPEAFDSGGNWVGFATTGDRSDPVATPAGSSGTSDKANKEADVKTKTQNEPTVIHLLKTTGVGNKMTTMASKEAKEGFFLGRFFKGKGYALISTPVSEGHFNKSAFLFVNKERTGVNLLKTLAKSKSFGVRVDGAEVFPASKLNPSYFEKDELAVYYITNVASACQALDAQDIQEPVQQPA